MLKGLHRGGVTTAPGEAAVPPSPYPPAEESRAALEAEGWSASATVVPRGGGWAWVVRAAKGLRAIEDRGTTDQEAWYLAARHARDIAAAEELQNAPGGGR
jgi:hypothetical protein